MAYLPCVLHIGQNVTVPPKARLLTSRMSILSDRLSSNGWDGRGLVVTLARTSSPTQPIAGPTKSPPCMIPHGYAAGYSTPPRRFARNMAFPVPPMSPE